MNDLAVRSCRQCDRTFHSGDHDKRWNPRKTALQHLCPRCIEWHEYCLRCRRARLRSDFTARRATECHECRNDRVSPAQYLCCRRCGDEFRGALKYARDFLCRDCRVTHKHCSSCNSSKPHGDFYTTKWVKDGLAGFCKDCRLARNRVGGKNHAAMMKRKFGLTEVEYRRMFDAQGGVCAICRSPETKVQSNSRAGSRALAIDHCHVTGKVRGLLCGRCNLSIGQFEDDPELLRAAADYVALQRIPQLPVA